MSPDLERIHDRYQLARLAGTAAEDASEGWDAAKLRALVASWQDVAPLYDEVVRSRATAAAAAVRREGICGDELPRALPGTPAGVCELTYGHGSPWHETPNADGSACRWRNKITGDASAGQTPGGTDG